MSTHADDLGFISDGDLADLMHRCHESLHAQRDEEEATAAAIDWEAAACGDEVLRRQCGLIDEYVTWFPHDDLQDLCGLVMRALHYLQQPALTEDDLRRVARNAYLSACYAWGAGFVEAWFIPTAGLPSQ